LKVHKIVAVPVPFACMQFWQWDFSQTTWKNIWYSRNEIFEIICRMYIMWSL